MSGFLVILRDAFADFRCRYPNNRVGGGIVVGFPAEDLDAQGPLLEQVGLALKSVVYDKTEKRRKSTALLEMRVAQQPFQLLVNRLSLFIRERCGDRSGIIQHGLLSSTG